MPISRYWRTTLFLVVLAGLATVFAAVAFATSQGPSDPGPVAVPSVGAPAWWTASLRAATPAEGSVVRQVSSFAGSDLLKAGLGSPPDGFVAAPQFGELGATWLYLQLAAADRSGAAVVANWQAMLIAGAYRDAAHTRNLPDLLGYSVQLSFPDGTVSGIDSTVIAEPFTHAVRDAATVQQDVARRVSALAGVHLTGEKTRNTGIGDAIVATVATTPDHVARRGLPQLTTDVFDDPGAPEGSLLVVEDESTGAVIAVSGFSARTGIGTAWVAGGIDGGNTGGVLPTP